MGVFGAGNFSSDDALDFFAIDIVDPLNASLTYLLREPQQANPDGGGADRIRVCVEVLCVLAERFDAHLPSPEVVGQCRDAFLAVWDAEIDGLGPKPGHKEQRRRVIVETFERLVGLARRRWGSQAEPV